MAPTVLNAPTNPHLAPLLESLRGTLEQNTNLTTSPQVVDARMQPQSNLDLKFSLDLQSRNTNQYRDRTHVRIEHTLRVGFLKRMNPNRQHETYLDALTIEEQVCRALMVQADNPTLTIYYDQTRRSLLPSREYLLVEVSFRVTGDLSITS